MDLRWKEMDINQGKQEEKVIAKDDSMPLTTLHQTVNTIFASGKSATSETSKN